MSPKVEDFHALDITSLRRSARDGLCSGRLVWRRNGEETASIGYVFASDAVTLAYAIKSDAAAYEAVREKIAVVFTKTNFGGSRDWFLCPACRRRCRILYGGNRFRCRLCLRAKYDSQYEPALIRISGRRWKIRRRLEAAGGEFWEWGLDDGFPARPRRMHRRTYRMLAARDAALCDRWYTGVRAWLERTTPPSTLEKMSAD